MPALLIAYLIGLCLASFLLGSIPWGMLISKFIFKVDIRQHGSGNIGSTNVFRILGAKGGLSCFALDFLKGFAAGLIAFALYADLCSGGMACNLAGGFAVVSPYLDTVFSLPSLQGFAVLFSVWGHIFNPWLHFKGGKGVAVGIGAISILIGWQLTVLTLAIFIAIVALWRYVSLGSLIASVVAVACAGVAHPQDVLSTVLVAVAVATIIWAHRANIKRLVGGTENKFSVRKS